MKKKQWYDYLWIWTIVYFSLGFFNILFACLGMIDFMLPMLIVISGGKNDESIRNAENPQSGVGCF